MIGDHIGNKYIILLFHLKVFTQTNDENFDQECQTDDIETEARWCQHTSDSKSGFSNFLRILLIMFAHYVFRFLVFFNFVKILQIIPYGYSNLQGKVKISPNNYFHLGERFNIKCWPNKSPLSFRKILFFFFFL